MLRRGCLIAATLSALAGRASGAQTVFDRTPNLAGGWVGSAGVLHFNFLHRFSISSAPERKVTNTPTFLLAAGLPGNTLFGATYATNSELSPRYPNEWEFFGRWAPFDQERGNLVDASIQAGYNLAAEGPDAEASVARRLGKLRVLGALRVLADPADDGGTDVAVAGGAVFRLTRGVALAADVATLTDRAPGEDVAWSAGVNLVIPHTPHTLSLHATNTNNASLESSSRGTGETRYGFEFTIPVTLSRYFGGGREDSVPPSAAAPPGGGYADNRRSRHRQGRGTGFHVPAGATHRRARHDDHLDQRRPGDPYGDRGGRQLRVGSDRERSAASVAVLQARHLPLPLHPSPVHEG